MTKRVTDGSRRDFECSPDPTKRPYQWRDNALLYHGGDVELDPDQCVERARAFDKLRGTSSSVI